MIAIGRLGTVLLAAALLAGCGDDGDGAASLPTGSPPPPSAAPAPAPTSSATTPPPAALPPCVPAFVANSLPDTDTPIGPPLGLQSATAAVQPGYDRVVFKLAGSTGKPGWDVRYVSAPTSDGSGDPVVVAGSHTLEVQITDVGTPPDTGIPDPAVKQFSPPGTVKVEEVVLDTVFEGRYTAFIGVDGMQAFRVFRLGGPPRLVVDVRHC